MSAAVIGALYAAFLLAGWLASRRVRPGDVSDLIVAGRAMPLWLATLTMTATWVDGGYLLGTAEGVYRSSLASGIQGGVCFGVSLILGGIFFARRMRELAFTTLIDPFEARFGRRWAAVLFLPAMFGEIFWSAELLVAIGSTLGVTLGLDLARSIVLSAVIVVAYTVLGGMWSVAYTDVLQLGLVALGLGVALPYALGASGGLEHAWMGYVAQRPEGSSLLPPLRAGPEPWTAPAIAAWWDTSLMLMLGGIPWNCYFQRVLSCRTPAKAQWHSIAAGLLTIAFTVPPLLMGLAAFAYAWPADLRERLSSAPSLALPLILYHVTPEAVRILGVAAIIGAVTSSFSASILSAGSMLSYNCCKRLLWRDLSSRSMVRILRGSVVALGAAAAVMALEVRSVQELWFFTSDLIFVLLFPQLLFALFDRRANLAGSIAAFGVSLLLRLGGGEPLLGIPPLIDYPGLFGAILPGEAGSWSGPDGGAMRFPVRTLAALAGLVLLPTVSRLTARWAPPRPLRNVAESE